ncbi:MAG: carboxypeptidase-like regulatory domain-containing protein, partial [Dysgonamonadaceae bacterium]|nr:carboxypeptidase-like regulatory domain-containing protein [Dysgonamonadaceae bacterium]
MQTNFITYSGIVVDSLTGKPIENALVTFFSINTDFPDSYYVRVKSAVTNKKGYFLVRFTIQKGMHFEITCLGYKVKKYPLTINYAEEDLGKLKMERDVQQLEEIVVRARMAMFSQNGDTTFFYPKSVKTLQGDPVLEVLRQMPGVEVRGSSVFIDGKLVERSYVNGRLIFGIDPTEAVTQIEAKDASLIMAYDEPDDQEVGTNRENARKRKVINILTFNPINEVSSGNLKTEAGGSEADSEWDRYSVSGELGFFKEQRQLKLTGGMDNFTPDYKQSGHSNTRTALFDYKKPRTFLDWLYYNYGNRSSTSEGRAFSTYFPDGQFESQTSEQSNRNTEQSDRHLLYWHFIKMKDKFVGLSGTTTLRFSNSHHTLSSFSEMLRDNAMLSSISDRSFSHGQMISIDSEVSFGIALKNQERRIAVKLGFSGALQKEESVRNSDRRNPASSYNETVNFDSKSPLLRLTANLSYRKDYHIMRGKWIRLNYYANVGTEWKSQLLTATDSITRMLDAGRSDDNKTRLTTFKAGVQRWQGTDVKLSFDISYSGSFLQRTERLPHDDVIDRYFHSPKFDITCQMGNFFVTLKNEIQLPPFMRFSSRLYDDNPYQLISGNPNLDATKKYTGELAYNRRFGGDGVVWLGINAGLISDAIIDNRTYFAEPTVLPQYNNYLTVAGATLSAPMNGRIARFAGTSFNFDKRLPFIRSIMKLSAGYTLTQNQTGVNSELFDSHERLFNNQLSLTTNFSSKFRVTLNNEFRHLRFENYSGRNDNRVTDKLKLTAQWDLTDRMFATSSYAMAHNSSSASDVTITDHVVNASFGIRLFKDRKGTLSL